MKSRKELFISFEDESVIAVDKPAGLPAIPIPNSEADSAWSMLSAMLKRKRARAYVVHRIDRFTSGLMLFAKTEGDRDVMVKQFLAHTPVREYLAVVRGKLPEKEGVMVHHFRKEGLFQRVRPAGEPGSARAELRYRVERPLRGASLVRVSIVTGLQNQIRAQFSAAGHPVIGDRKYNPEEAKEKHIDRVALHSAHLEFRHPRTRKMIVVESEPPPDFKSLVKMLSPKPPKPQKPAQG
jgi:23S rRNA pseudouridine1911/1915/1917 synthase